MNDTFFISIDEFQQRKETTLSIMKEKQLDALIAFSSYQEREGNVCYLTNHHNTFPNGMSHTGLGHAAFLLFQNGDGVLIAPLGYQKKLVANVDKAYVESDIVTGISHALKNHDFITGKVGIAGLDVIPTEYYLRLSDDFSSVIFQNANEVIETQRAIKSPAEIELIREAARIAGVGLKAGMATIKPGVTQHEIEFAARRAAFNEGADFIPRVRVSTGKRIETLNWPMTSKKVLENGDFVFLDFIGWFANYGWDNSRVTIVGTPTSEEKAFLDHMVEATAWMIESMKPYKDMEFVFTESRGNTILPMAHGIGLEICENPWVNANKRFTLSPGMVLCVEPIVSNPAFGGMCIEDTILVREEGIEVLTEFERVYW